MASDAALAGLGHVGRSRNPVLADRGGECRLSLAPLRDEREIDRILRDPWIAARLAHDDRAPGHIDHPAVSYFGAWVNGELKGVFICIRVTSCDVEVHAALKREAMPLGRAFGRMLLQRLFADPRLLRVTAHVLASLPTAVNYCRKLGFSVEGVRRDACLQKTSPVAVITLGCRRADFAEQ